MKSADELQAQLQKSFVFPHILNLTGAGSATPPILAQFNELIPELCGLPYDYAYKESGQALAEGALLVWEYLDVDMVFAIVDSYNLEAESIGAKVDYYPDHIPDINRNDLLIKQASDLEKIRFNGLQSGRYPFLLDFWDAYINYTGMPGFPEACAPWSLATNIYGIENLLVACLTDPAFVHEMMGRIVDDLLAPLIKELRKRYNLASSFILPDAWCSAPMVNAAIIAEFVEPYVQRLRLAIGEGLSFNQAAIWLPAQPVEERDAFLEVIVRQSRSITGFDPEDSGIGFDYFREQSALHQVPWSVSVSPGFISAATPEAAAERGKLFALEGRKGAMPCTVAFGCIPPFAPLENVRSFIQAVRTYGAPGSDSKTPMPALAEATSFRDFVKEKIEHNTEGYSFDWLAKSTLDI